MIEPRELLGLIPHGLYLFGVRTETSKFIYTGSWLTQASFEPPLVVTAVRRRHRGHRLIHDAGAFAVSFLEQGQLELAKVGFGTPGVRLAEVRRRECPVTGAAVVSDCF